MNIFWLHLRLLRIAQMTEDLRADGFAELAVKKVCYFKHSQFIVVGTTDVNFWHLRHMEHQSRDGLCVKLIIYVFGVIRGVMCAPKRDVHHQSCSLVAYRYPCSVTGTPSQNSRDSCCDAFGKWVQLISIIKVAFHSAHSLTYPSYSANKEGFKVECNRRARCYFKHSQFSVGGTNMSFWHAKFSHEKD